uniref:ERCC excision repair 6, chromatin remodeling factor n=1 Tax=Homo sapiens TaxID=9606 RepID=A0A7P0T7Y4_HUMAN
MRESPTQVKLRSKTVYRVNLSVIMKKWQSSKKVVVMGRWRSTSPFVLWVTGCPPLLWGAHQQLRGEGQPCCTSTDIRSRQ